MIEIAQQIPADKAPLASHGANPLNGRFTPPGDRSISQLALILGALAVGRSSIVGLPETADVLAMATALRQFGVRIEQRDDAWQVHGLGVAGLLESAEPLELAECSGTELLLGALAPYPFATGFAGVPARSLQPVLAALAPIGATATAASEGGLKLTLKGPRMALPLQHRMATPSETVKSALLLAAAQIAGITTIVEPVATGDHAEKLLAAFGAAISIATDAGGATVSITGLTELAPRHVVVPGDPSASAYPVLAALIVPGSDLIVENVLINPARTGLIDTLLQMGGDIQFLNQHEAGGEHVADLRVRSSRLKGIRVDAAHAAAMLEDIPALAIAAAYGQGETVIEGLGGLRGQDGDRLAALAAGLAACRVTVAEGDTSLTIGGIGKVDGGGMVASRGDAAIAMSFLVLGLASQKRVTVDDTSTVAASFPGFVAAMSAAGARLEPVKGSSP